MIARHGPFYKFCLGLARSSLLWEHLWPALWPATALAGLFIGAALLDIFSLLPLWLHTIVVMAALVGFAGALYHVFIQFPKIGVEQARHRLEIDSGLDHRPLASLDDNLALGSDDVQARALWEAHQARMTAQTEHIQLALPKAGLARRDPWGLRAAVSLVLLAGIIAAGTDSFSRIGNALSPPLSTESLAPNAELSIWITPPAYTGEIPVVLRVSGKDAATLGESAPVVQDPAAAKSETDTIRVPVGSTVLAQMTGGRDLPTLHVGAEQIEFGRIEADTYHAETELGAVENGVTDLAVLQKGREVASWSLRILNDERPTVAFSDAPEISQQLRLQLPYEAKDDYRLTGVTAYIRRLDGLPMPDGKEEIILRMPLPGEDRKAVTAKSNNDLVSHIWAGLPVLVHFLASDELDQTGVSQVEPVVLPERRFSNPVAKEIYEIRKGISIRKRDRKLAILKLDLVADEPARFDRHTGVYLGLRIARERLLRDPANATVSNVQKMLWDMALRLEEGLAADASNGLRAVQRRLQEAFDRGASPEELERLLNEVEKALQEFMQSLIRELQQRGQITPQSPQSQILTSDDMLRMLDRARELMRQGSREPAKQLMAELQRMLENLRSALSRNGLQSQHSREAQQAMRDLRGLVQRQQKLLDETHRRAQKERDQLQQESIERSTEGQKEQETIRRQLGEMMRKFNDLMGQIPKGLGDAERAMKESEQALGQGRQGKSIDPQTRALEALRQGAQNSARALARRMGQGQQRFGRQGGRFGTFTGPRLRGMRPGNRDPFGRRIEEEEGTTGTATGRIKIPDESEIQRARRILEELRRRAGDLWRPEQELEYIERLLKRF